MSRLEANGEPEVFTDHNVYILGAGFSVDAGIPVLDNFLYEMRGSLNWLRQQGREFEREEIAKVLSFRKSAASAALRVALNIENIEDLFSLAAASVQYPLEQSVSNAIGATIDYSKANAKPLCFEATVKHAVQKPDGWRQITPGPESAVYRIPCYDAFAGLLSGKACTPHEYMKNTVITFNYDTVLEESLARWKVPVWYGFEGGTAEYKDQNRFTFERSGNALAVLKLHGSVNWAGWSTGLGVDVYGSYSDVLAAGEKVLLLPPTWRKAFGGALGQIWDHAVQALSTATRIVIIGFSLPPTDIHIKFLLAAGLQDNISLRNIYCFNPNPQVENNLFEILRGELKKQRIVEFCPYHLQDLLLGRSDDYKPYSSKFNRSTVDTFMNIRLASDE
jgi:hypothetical protein